MGAVLGNREVKRKAGPNARTQTLCDARGERKGSMQDDVEL